MDDKTKSIVAHFHLLGWIVALILNQKEKGSNTSFYLRQMLGLLILFVIVALFDSMPIPILPWILWMLLLILWVLSLVGALGGTEKPIPIFGEMFQQWFKGIS